MENRRKIKKLKKKLKIGEEIHKIKIQQKVGEKCKKLQKIGEK